MIVLPPQRWTRQPQGAVEVDWGNPLARGLKLSLNFGSGYIPPDSVSGVIGGASVIGTPATLAPTSAGLALLQAGNGIYGYTSDAVTALLSQMSNTGPRTFVWIGGVTAWDSWGGLFALAATSGTANYGGIGRVTGGTTLRMGTGGGRFYDFANAYTALATGQQTVLVATVRGVVSGGPATLYINGQKFSFTAQNTDTPTTPTSLRVNLFAEQGFSTTYSSEGWVNAFHVFDREFDDSDAAEVLENPWQIFRPLTRRLYVQVGGGAITGEANLPGTGGITVTGRLTAKGSASLGGIGSVSIAGKLNAKGVFNNSGVGSITVNGRVGAKGSATLGGIGGITVDGNIADINSALLPGVGGITVSGKVIAKGAASLPGVGGLTSTGTLHAYSTATLPGYGSLTVTAPLPVGTGEMLGNYRAMIASPTTLDGMARWVAGELRRIEQAMRKQ